MLAAELELDREKKLAEQTKLFAFVEPGVAADLLLVGSDGRWRVPLKARKRLRRVLLVA